jgi:hypothetical protein
VLSPDAGSEEKVRGRGKIKNGVGAEGGFRDAQWGTVTATGNNQWLTGKKDSVLYRRALSPA